MYAERPVLSPIVACTWEQTTVTALEQRVVPDACVDLIWAGGDRLTVAGPDTVPRVVALPPGSRLVGVRLRTGAAGAVLGLPASDLRDISPDAADVLGRRSRRSSARSSHRGRGSALVLLRGIQAHGAHEPDPLVRAAVAALDRPRVRVSAVAAELGVSPRQLQRRIAAAVGYGPKTLARVLRFRRLQALPTAPLIELALEAGYADQAHMTAEVTRLAGVSPVRFLKDRRATAA